MRKIAAAMLCTLALATAVYVALTGQVGDGTHAATAVSIAPHAAPVPQSRRGTLHVIHPTLPRTATRLVARPVRGMASGHGARVLSFALPSRPRIASTGAPPGITLVVPRLGIQAPVHEGKPQDGILPIAPGYSATHYFNSAGLGQPGNYVVYGHDDIEGKIFEYLGSLRVGDRVYFHRGTRRYTYVVTGQQIVDPSDVAVLDPTPNATLTMISCTPLWVDSQRIVIHGVFVGVDG